MCRKKIKTTCECKSRKIEISCEKLRFSDHIISCDKSCETKKREIKLAAEKIKESEKFLEDEKNRLELEMFEKKFGKKRYKEKRINVIDEKNDNKKIIWIAGSMIFISAVFFLIIVN